MCILWVKMRCLVAVVCASFYCVHIIYAGELLPYISPVDYNASLNGTAVEFTCVLPHDLRAFVWLINGSVAASVGQEVLSEQGIIYSDTWNTDSNRTFVVTTLEPTAENNNTELGCEAYPSNTASNRVMFRVQGLLAAPTELEIRYLNSTHDELVWKDPYTLDLTDILHDITGYTVTIIMSHPPPSFPYDLSVTLDHLPHTSNQTYNISRDGQVSFPRYTFPVWLSIRAENPVGLGATSPPLKYTPHTTTDDCIRLHEMVSPQPDSEVTVIFTDTSSPSVEIQLTELTSSQSGVDYCFDTVEMVLWPVNEIASGKGDRETHVLVPILSETGVSVVLESDLDSDTHYKATLSVNSLPLTSTTFSTYAVQDVMIDVHSNGLTVECVFAAGPPETSCTVILVMYGVELRRETSSGVMTFHDLDSGNYTVLVYDSDSVMEGSSVPAIERDVKVTNADIVPDLTFSVTKDTVTVSPSEASTSTDTSTPSSTVTAVIIGSTVLLAVTCTSVTVVIILLVRRRHKSSNTAVVSLATNVIYDEIPLPSPEILTEPNSAYITTRHVTPPIITARILPMQQ